VGAKSRLVGTQEGAGKGVGGAREGGGRRGREEREAGLRERAVGGESNSTPRQRVVEGGERKTTASNTARVAHTPTRLDVYRLASLPMR